MSWSPLDENDPSNTAVIGDEPFDLISDCFRKVARLYQRDWTRKPSLYELIGTVQSVLEAQLQDCTSDGESAELASLRFKTRKIPKRQKYVKGDVLKAEAANGEAIFARLFDIDPWLGPMVGVYDSLGMSSTDLDAIIQKPLIVKIFPIHRELLEKREWLVIGNRPLSKADAELPRGPNQIAGSNEQLETANYHYGLGPKAFYNIEDCMVQSKVDGTDTSRRLVVGVFLPTWLKLERP
jgi:hypothetical protein